jgi:ATP-dependent Clp protease ATP-binding subunit ClpA
VKNSRLFSIWSDALQRHGSNERYPGAVFERFTDRARTVLVLAQEEARLLNHGFIGTEHILLGIIREGEGVGARVLESFGVSLEAAREKVRETIGMSGTSGESPPFTPRAKKVLELSLREALQLNHSYIGTEHLLLGLVREGEGVATFVLIDLGADPVRIRQEVIHFLSEVERSPGSPLQPGMARAARTEGVEGKVEPRCPRCRAPVTESARFRTIDVLSESGREDTLSVKIVFCLECGTALNLFEGRPA